MSNKKVLRQNAKILKDAKEYLELVTQLNHIRRVIVDHDKNITDTKRMYLEKISPIIQVSEDVAAEVLKVTEELKTLPSTAPAYKRRATAKHLKELMMDRAMHIQEVFTAILDAASLFEEKELVSAEEIEELVNE